MSDTQFEFQQGEADSQYLETIALLQDEVARLEAELSARESDESEMLQETEPITLGPVGSSLDEVLMERDRLASELAAREETIGLLLEQLNLIEEVERATRLEWEQLASWVADLEERVDQRFPEVVPEDSERLSLLERRAAEAEAALQRDRVAWDLERCKLHRETERLASMVEARGAERQDPSPTETSSAARIKLLESEVEALHQHCLELEAEHQHAAMNLNEALETARGQLNESRQQVRETQDERERERREYETAVSSIRAQLVRTALHVEPQGGGDTSRSQESGGALEADLRIREFRQHLREIHAQEEETRSRNTMSARLSRLWKRTAPASSVSPAEGVRQ